MAGDRSETGRRYLRGALGAVALIAAILALQALIPRLASLDVDLSLQALGALAHRAVSHNATHLLATYGYAAVLLFVAIESIGIPFPGETMLLAAAIYAGTTHHLSIALVIIAAAAGAIVGDNLGYLLGREGGYRLLRRYGRYVRLDERRLKLGQYLFLRHGGKVVFFGRFVTVLRIWAAFLAGAYRLPWRRFLLYNAAGGVAWATLYGVGGYALGNAAHRLGGLVGAVGVALAIVALLGGGIVLRRNERRLAAEAERALPGPFGRFDPVRVAKQAPPHRAGGRQNPANAASHRAEAEG